MPDSPFRNDAADTLVSTQELDQASRMIRLQARTFLALVGFLVVAAGIAGFVIKVPVKVAGPGVLWTNASVHQVSATTPGRVQSIHVTAGALVESGSVIARLDQSALAEQLRSAQANLQALQDHLAASTRLQDADVATRAELSERVDQLIATSGELNRARLARLQGRRTELEDLRQRGLIEADRFDQLISQIEESETRLLALERETINELKQTQSTNYQQEREQLQLQLQASQLRTEVALLQHQLEQKGELRTPVGGQVVEVTMAVGDYLTPGLPTIVVQPDAGAEDIGAVIFVPGTLAKPITPGMPVELEMAAFAKNMHGLVLGEVESASPLPLSSSALLHELRNDQLVKSITEQGSPFMVRVRLLRTKAGDDFKWSSVSEFARPLQRGMMAQGGIIVRRERLIDLLLPRTR